MSADARLTKQIFDQALEHPPSERGAFLDEACAGDSVLRREIDALLAAIGKAGGFLADPVEEGQFQGACKEHPGAKIDRYRLQQVIGEGGFGTVWMAEQQEPVRRKVALKVIKLGMDTNQVIARFEAERQALALMDHPSIAKIHDGGVTPSGRPFFVMELIQGIPITDYCDQAGLSTTDRLDLFQQVCHAVQHAHQKGVIHRDLKPSNILVTLHDGMPVPKVIDFGIAKATSAELTKKTLFTEFKQLIGTPEYMAPEQAGLSQLDIDTRADVYSLGVLLYEMLTGTKPFDSRKLLDQGYGEMLRVIREEDPPKPSTRVSTMREDQAVVARHRHTTPRTLSRLIRGDLDWIVMKALEKDRGRRYATANDLAADIGRHVLDEPVDAGPPSAAYRMRKYFRRHRVGVSAGGAVGLALFVGLAAAAWGYVEASDQRDAADAARHFAVAGRNLAKTEAARANSVIDLVERMLSSADPHQNKGKDFTVRQLLDDFDRDLGERLEEQPQVEAAIRHLMGNAYRGLGILDKSGQNLEEALLIRRRLYKKPHPTMAINLRDMASLQHDQGNYGVALKALEQAAKIMRSTHGDDASVAWIESLRADMLQHLGEIETAVRVARTALDLARDALGPDHLNVATSLVCLSRALHAAGKREEALSKEHEALRIQRLAYPGDHPNIAERLNNIGWISNELGDLEGASRLISESIEMKRRMSYGNRMELAASLNGLGVVYQRLGKLDDALVLHRDAARMSKVLYGRNHFAYACARLNVGVALHGKGLLDEAETVLRDTLEIYSRLIEEEHPAFVKMMYVNTRIKLAALLHAQGKEPEAADEYKKSISLVGSHLAANSQRHLKLLSSYGAFLVDIGRFADAELVLCQCLEILKEQNLETWLTFNAMSVLGAALVGQGKYGEAEPFLLDSYERMQPLAIYAHRKRDALAKIVGFYEDWGKKGKAESWRQKLEVVEAAARNKIPAREKKSP